MTPISAAEGGSVPPKVAPFGAAPAAAPSAGVSTIKLKPVIRKPMIHKPTIGARPPVPPTVPAAPAKKATQNLKSVTGPIPVQATLKKTGIIAEGIITPQQQQAAKSKTSRISLESAIGVAPAKEEREKKAKEQWPELLKEWMEAGVEDSSSADYRSYSFWLDPENKTGYASVRRGFTREGELRTVISYVGSTYNVKKGHVKEAIEAIRTFHKTMKSCC